MLLTALHRSLLAGLDDSARQRAKDVGVLVDSGRLPDPIPVAGGTAVVQVVDAEHRVLAASAGGDRLVPLLPPAQLAAARRGWPITLDGARIGVSDQLRVLGVPAGSAADPQTVLVAVSLTDVSRSLRVVQVAALVGIPLLLLGVAGLSWLLTRSALRSVAELRRGAEEISGTGATRRLPVPAARDELHRLAATLNRMLDRLDAAAARQRAFVADAAHELRSPLASARTQLEVALRHPGSADWPDTGAGVLEDAERMSRLVDDLLVLARLDEEAGPTRRRETVDLAALTAEVVRRAEPAPVTLEVTGPALRGADPGASQRTGSAALDVTGQLAPEATDGPPAYVRGDRDALARVVTNLLDNALRHASRRACVDVSVGDEVVLTVTDDGPGIPPAERERVFERFTRLDPGRGRGTGGTGLGLAIVREIVSATGGTVALYDAEPGVRAVVRLPLSEVAGRPSGPAPG